MYDAFEEGNIENGIMEVSFCKESNVNIVVSDDDNVFKISFTANDGDIA